MVCWLRDAWCIGYEGARRRSGSDDFTRYRPILREIATQTHDSLTISHDMTARLSDSRTIFHDCGERSQPNGRGSANRPVSRWDRAISRVNREESDRNRALSRAYREESCAIVRYRGRRKWRQDPRGWPQAVGIGERMGTANCRAGMARSSGTAIQGSGSRHRRAGIRTRATGDGSSTFDGVSTSGPMKALEARPTFNGSVRRS